MVLETLIFSEIGLLPELFLGISIIYFLIHGTFLSVSRNYPLIQTSSLYLAVLILSMVGFLLINDCLDVLEYSIFNNTIANDYLAFSSKFFIIIFSILGLLIIQQYLVDQKINNFEYILLLLFSILGVMIMCSANDLITVYLSIELQSLAFYVMSAFKKKSTFSVDAGLKYFILGSFSSGFFLFGSSLIYGLTGSVNFEDFRDLFFWVIPGSSILLSDINYSNYDYETTFEIITNKVKSYSVQCLTEQDFNFLITHLFNPTLVYLKQEQTVFGRLALFSHKSIAFKTMHYNTILPEEPTQFMMESYYYSLTVEKDLNNFYMSGLIREALDYSGEDPYKNLVRLDLECVGFARIIIRMAPHLIWFDSFQDNSFFTQNFDTHLLQFSLMFILVSLFFKLALAPFHLWSPDVYEGSPSSSTFFFAVISKLGIFIVLSRIFYYGFYGFIDNWRPYIIIIAVLSVIVGSFGGIEQRKLKSLLAYSSISHMGYTLIAFNSGTFEGFQMLFCYLIIYMLSGLCLWAVFLATRLKNVYENKQNKDLADLVLLKKSNKILAFVFSIVLLSIAGFPPMVGFLVKMGIFLVAIESSLYYASFISILCSVVSTFYYIRIVKILYFEKVLVGRLYYPINTIQAIIIIIPFYLLIFLFVNPTLLYLLSYKLSLLFMG